MATASLGTKRECSKCAAKFYDLGATPVVCPKCKTTQKLSEKPKSPPKQVQAPKPKKIAIKPVVDDEDDHLGELEDTSEALEELDDLDDAPEVISLEEVEEHQEESEVDPNSDDAEEGMFMEELEGDSALFDPLDPDGEEESEEEEDETDEDDAVASRKRKKK
jgi:hypothetical protein